MQWNGAHSNGFCEHCSQAFRGTILMYIQHSIGPLERIGVSDHGTVEGC